MRHLAFLIVTCGLLSACVGSQLTERDVDLSAPYPSLHSVPDRPCVKDFVKIDAEREEFENSYETEIDLNDAIRSKYNAPDRINPKAK